MHSGLTSPKKEKSLNPIEIVAGIKGLTIDSRQVQPGFLFAAFKGNNVDGTAFIANAISKGARVILAETGTTLPSDIHHQAQLITHDNPRKFFATLAAAFYAAQPDTIVAVTGTNGKTSIAYFCQQLWNHLAIPAVSIGTIGICGKGHPFHPSDSLTTPDTVTLHHTLSTLVNEGIKAVAMEASSHGLDQYRLDGLQLKAAGFTNLTRDHLDYHHTLEAYYQAKLRLFTEILPEHSIAVLNADIAEYQDLKHHCSLRHHTIIDYGTQADTLTILSLHPKAYGQSLQLRYRNHIYTLDIPLIGEFQIYNALCAAGLLIGTGMDEAKVIPALSALKPAPGRMELVPGSHETNKAVFVDYAHTPDALEKALRQLRPYTQAKLWVVFGCGGDRDKGKRPEMGNIASLHADHCIVTDDNPRNESPDSIRQAILEACPGAKEIGDRSQAIRYAIKHMQPGDVLLIAGKGHEKTQKIGKEAFPFDDVEVAEKILRAVTI